MNSKSEFHQALMARVLATIGLGRNRNKAFHHQAEGRKREESSPKGKGRRWQWDFLRVQPEGNPKGSSNCLPYIPT